MDRRKFIQTALVTTSLTATARTASATPRDSKGFKINAGEGRLHGHIKLKGVNENILDVKVSGKDTDGDLAIFEQTSLSPKQGTPLHLHYTQDEIFFVQLGEYQFQVGQDKYRLKAGDSIFLPRMVPHSWIQVSESGKMNVTFQPAGKLEEFFLTMQALQTQPTPKELAKIFEDHGMKIVGPPTSID